MTIREFARLVLPIYRRERWKWAVTHRVQGPMRVPTEAEIMRAIRQLIFYRRRLPVGYSSRSGGLTVTRYSGKTLQIEMMPRRWHHPKLGYGESGPLQPPLVSQVVIL